MKILKIKKRIDFINIQNSYNKKLIGNHLIVLCKNTNNKYITITKKQKLQNFIRIGYTVTKKVDKKAVIRNKIKRILREINRNLLKNANYLYNNHMDYEFIAKKNIIYNNNYKTLYKEVEDLLNKNNGK